MAARYTPIPASEVPEGLRWDTPKRHQGQIMEVAYADAAPGVSPADRADDPSIASEYQRTTDRSTGHVTYARLVQD